MLRKIKELANKGKNFAFESTLATRSFVPLIKECKENKYKIRIIFIWLHSPLLAIERVSSRVLYGGHPVPKETILRRYERGHTNFIDLYRPLADFWQIFDNSEREYILLSEGKNSYEIDNL